MIAPNESVTGTFLSDGAPCRCCPIAKHIPEFRKRDIPHQDHDVEFLTTELVSPKVESFRTRTGSGTMNLLKGLVPSHERFRPFDRVSSPFSDQVRLLITS